MPVVTENPAAAAKREWKSFVNGQFVAGEGNVRTLINPADGSELCTIAESSSQQVQKAIESARAAFDGGSWSSMTAQDRARILFSVADRLEQEAAKFAVIETLNAGKPMREAMFDVTDSVNCFRYYAGLITKPTGQTVDVPAPYFTQVVREPIGVCGQIIPWNYPLLMAAWKLAPALAAGNSCVLKPSELTPLTALMLAELIQAVGVPEGTINIVLGDGNVAGQPLAESMLIDKIAFTGSAATGRRIVQYALSNLKKVTLELGGKSPMVVFDDVDVDRAVDYAMFAIFCHAGQVCSAGSRFLVQANIYDEFLKRFVERSGRIAVGPGMDAATEMGPLISQQQLDKAIDYIKVGVGEKAKLECGGDRPEGAKYGQGFYLKPTIFSGATPDMRIVQEEIFGPVAVVEKFQSEADAVRLANCTRYGLAGAVFTNSADRAYRVGKALRAGVVWLNGFHYCPNEAPFGGYKESGWGRECGTFGLDAYTEVKQLSLNLDAGPAGWFKQ